MIEAKIFERTLNITDIPVSDSVKFETVRFTFPSSWDGFEKTAVFSDGKGVQLNVVLNSESALCVGENECYVPHEVLKYPYFYVSVFGFDGERVATTTKEKVRVLESGYALGDDPSEPTPSEYQQIINLSANAVDVAQSVRNDADNGLFKGEKGDKGDQGPRGEKGEKGEKGEQGIPGAATPEFIEMVEKTEENAQKTEQAYGDFLSQLGVDIATLVGGKIPLSQIPATATQEIYTVSSEAELTGLTAQRGDLAELLEEVNGERTVIKTWQCLGDSSKRENWVVWGTSYAVSAGNAATAENAKNANTINNHRLIEISYADFETAVKDENTYYLVY